MAIITPALVSALFTGFRAEFQRVYGETPSHWDKVATLMPSTSKSNTYGWLGQFPQLVEWVGPRVLKDMAAHGYSITNKLFESTVGVKRTDIEDDEVGIYKPLFGEMGRASKSFPDELVYGLLRLGLSTLWIGLGFSWTPTWRYESAAREVSYAERGRSAQAILGASQDSGRAPAASRRGH